MNFYQYQISLAAPENLCASPLELATTNCNVLI